jgi:hypothetical protein
MPLQRLTLDHMSCFAIGFPLLDITQYPQAPFAVANVSPCWISHNMLRPSCTLWLCRYHHISTAHPTRQFTRGSLISQQAIPYWTRGGTCYPGVSTIKIRSLADSSSTCCDGINHLHYSNHCSNRSIDPHHGHLTS